MSSPLGKYAAVVAAVVSLGVITAWIIAEFLLALGLSSTAPAGLKEMAFIAIGQVLGSAVTVNGWRQPVEAAHHRIDELESATGIPTHQPDSTASDHSVR